MTLKPPEDSEGDALHALAKAGISSLPIIGAATAEIFQWVVPSPLERRRDEWMRAVSGKLQELEERQGINLAALGQNEEFVSAVMYATTIAIRTHKEEKHEALRNAVINVALGQSPDEALEHMFFGWIDTFSVLHLRVLKLAYAPSPIPNKGMATLTDVLQYNEPLLKSGEDVFQIIWKDLYTRGLVSIEQTNTTMTGIDMGFKRTTAIGDQFLAFISEPDI